MPSAIRVEDEAIVIDGGHPNVSATVVEEQCPGKRIQVRVNPLKNEAARLFTEEGDLRKEAYYDGPLSGHDVSFRVFLVKFKTGGSEDFARFRSAGPPE